MARLARPARVCMISVLNPLTHSRIYEKEAQTLAEAGYELHVLAQGRTPEQPPATGKLHLHATGVFGRLSIQRCYAPFLLMYKALKLRPDVVHLHAPELLLPALVFCLSRRVKLVYDVHEDYAANIRAGRGYASWVRAPLAWAVRQIERIAAAAWVDGVVYAENSYSNILKAKNFSVVENRYRPMREMPVLAEPPPGPGPVLLHTGTLAPAWGTWRAIALWETLNRQAGPTRLWLVGHAPQARHFAELQSKLAQSEFAHLAYCLGGDAYVPYAELLALLPHCTAGLALYEPDSGLGARVPTKFWEFGALGKPMLFTPLPEWLAFDAEFGLGQPIYFPLQPSSAKALYAKLLQSDFPIPKVPSDPWRTEAENLLGFYNDLLSPSPKASK